MAIRNLIALGMLFSLTGCAGQYWSNGESGSKTGAGVITWDTNQSAALVVPKGGVPSACTQMALATNDETKKFQSNISESLLSVLSNIPSNSTPGDLVAIAAELTKVSKILNTSTERTTYLQVGGFYLCQLQANGLSETGLITLMNALISASAVTVASGQGAPSTSDTNDK